jgi:hypothetical protein
LARLRALDVLGDRLIVLLNLFSKLALAGLYRHGALMQRLTVVARHDELHCNENRAQRTAGSGGLNGPTSAAGAVKALLGTY